MELVEKYGVSICMIYRDIRVLEEVGVFICMEEGKGYFLSEGYCLLLVMFMEEEVNVLIIVVKFIVRNKDSFLVFYYNEVIIKIKVIFCYYDKDKVEFFVNRIVFF